RTRHSSTPFPYTTLFRSPGRGGSRPRRASSRIPGLPRGVSRPWCCLLRRGGASVLRRGCGSGGRVVARLAQHPVDDRVVAAVPADRKSTRLNSSHVSISY